MNGCVIERVPENFHITSPYLIILFTLTVGSNKNDSSVIESWKRHVQLTMYLLSRLYQLLAVYQTSTSGTERPFCEGIQTE